MDKKNNNKENNSNKNQFDEEFEKQVNSVQKMFDAYNKSKEDSEEER